MDAAIAVQLVTHAKFVTNRPIQHGGKITAGCLAATDQVHLAQAVEPLHGLDRVSIPRPEQRTGRQASMSQYGPGDINQLPRARKRTSGCTCSGLSPSLYPSRQFSLC